MIHTAKFFYEKYQGITYIATGLGGISSDSMLKVSINESDVDFKLIPLILQPKEYTPIHPYMRSQPHSNKDIKDDMSLPITTYNSAYWENLFQSPLQVKAKYLLHLHIFSHPYFWYGVIIMGLLTTMGIFIYNIRTYIIKKK